LQDWSAIGRLHLVTVPVFVINGAADTADTHAVAPLFFGLPRARWVTMDGSSHMPFWEERARFGELVDQWLRA
jgi:pimeloyl-ACP methyl ester carboxylesterase